MKILLDVDGVVSPMPPDDHFAEEWGEWDHLDVPWRWTKVNLAKAMGDALAALPAEICWLTTWDDAANEIVGGHFGWPACQVMTRHPDAAILGKYHAVRDYAKLEEPFVWLEDDIPSLGACGPLLDIPQKHLVIAPDPEVGLTKMHMTLIEEFFARV